MLTMQVFAMLALWGGTVIGISVAMYRLSQRIRFYGVVK